MSDEEIPHGTRAGYVTARCRCDECRAAHAEYQRQYRKAVGRTSRDFALRRARSRALERLSDEEPERFAVLYAEECAVDGLTPPDRSAPRGGYRTRGTVVGAVSVEGARDRGARVAG